MKFNKKIFYPIAMAAMALVLLVAMVVLPATAASATYVSQNFNSIPLGKKGSAGLQSYFWAGQRVPSKAEIVLDPANPSGTNRVIKIESAVEATGPLGYDAIVLFSSTASQITWNSGTTVNAEGQTVYSGTITYSNATYFLESVDNKQTVRVVDQKGNKALTVTDGKIPYNNETVTLTFDNNTVTDRFGDAVLPGFMTSGSKTYYVKSYDGGKTCIVMDKYGTACKVYNTADLTEALAGNSTGNVDRNLVVKNQKMSGNTVVMQADYYVEKDSKGVFESQHINFSAENSTANAWLGLYRVNLELGAIVPMFSVTSGEKSIPVEKEAWNTVSMVINLVTGEIDLYVNNICRASGVLASGGVALTGVTLNAERWNVAKLMKSSAPENYKGAIYIDNIVAHSCDSGMIQYLPKENNANGEIPLYVDLTTKQGKKVSAGPGAKYLVNEGVSAKNVYLPNEVINNLLAPVPGASIRLSNSSGIRFGTQINTENLAVLEQYAKDGYIKRIELGTLITPMSYVKEAGAITFEALKQLSYSAKYLDVKATSGKYFTIPGFALDEGFDKTFVGSIINIRHANTARDFSAVGYVRIILNDGSEKYIYSYQYTDDVVLKDNYSRNIAQVAKVFVNDPAYAQYKDVLQSFIDGTTVMNLSSSIVKNAEYSINTFYFQNSSGISVRITYDGNNGWRMQAVKPTQSTVYYNNFDNMGAAQALSMYLGEGYNDITANLTVTQENGKIKLSAEGTGSYVLINTTGSFNIQFMSDKGVLMNNVTSITSDGKTIVAKGDLLANEAIYGGGERFDSANKRGKLMQLYSYDAFNGGGKDDDGNFAGTYTVIPLFTSSRGSGMYINRYEIMSADWGRASANQWKLDLQNDLLDMYFYSTGNMTDAIKGYTDLAGHATLPEEWAQGVLICRYSPDFNSLEGETMVYETLTDIPGYESLLATANGTKTAFEKWAENGFTFTNGTYIYSGSTRKYLYTDTDGDGTLEFIRTTKKGNPSGAGVKTIVQNLIDAGMKPDAMVLEGLGWGNLATNEGAMNNFKSVINWLENQGIRTTLYMAVGSLNSSMPGYKKEYQLHADVVTTVTKESNLLVQHNYVNESVTNTISIPKSAASDNPDAFGSGSTNYLDITNPEAVEWYMDVVWGMLIDLGIDGCKIDFCEIMPNGSAIELTAKNRLTGKYEVVANTKITYHWYDPTVFEDDEVHHAYSSYFISEFMKSMLEQKEAKNIPDGFVALSRGGGIGSQRNPYMWGGDQARNEVNLTTQLLCVLNSGISGIPFMTYDMAGYAYEKAGGYYDWNGWDDSKKDYINVDPANSSDIEAKIFLRAIQYTAFGNMIQTHGDVRHMYELELKDYAEGYAQEVSALYTRLHQDLMPYLQKYSRIACDTGMPIMRHMVLHYQNDANVYNMDDQFMFGDALMVAPILHLDVYQRDVYLPEGKWMDLLTGEEYEVGAGGMTITVSAELDQIPVFLNMNASDANLKMLDTVFNGANWQAVNRGIELDIYSFKPSYDDPWGEDIF